MDDAPFVGIHRMKSLRAPRARDLRGRNARHLHELEIAARAEAAAGESNVDVARPGAAAHAAQNEFESS
jgi:hypothetical protein